MKPKLDIETMQRLYEFGALMYYEVRYFDSPTFTIKTKVKTFSESLAVKECDFLNRNKIKADIYSCFIKFDGEFSVKEEKGISNETGRE